MVKELSKVCKLIEPGFLQAIEQYTQAYSPSDTPIHKDFMKTLHELAKECGFEKEGDVWVQFPKQRDTFYKAMEYGGGGDILETLCNGDIIIEMVKQGKAIVTTDGDIYYQSKHVRA